MMRISGLALATFALALTAHAAADKEEDPFDFDEDNDDFDDEDTGYGRQPVVRTTGAKKPLPEGVQPGSILFEICTG